MQAWNSKIPRTWCRCHVRTELSNLGSSLCYRDENVRLPWWKCCRSTCAGRPCQSDTASNTCGRKSVKLEDGCHKTHQVTIYVYIYIYTHNMYIHTWLIYEGSVRMFLEIYEFPQVTHGHRQAVKLSSPMASCHWLNSCLAFEVQCACSRCKCWSRSWRNRRCHWTVNLLNRYLPRFKKKLTATGFLHLPTNAAAVYVIFFHRNSAHSSHLPKSSQVRGWESSPAFRIPAVNDKQLLASLQIYCDPSLSSRSLPLSMLFACFGIQTQVVSIPCVQQVKIIMEKHLTGCCFGLQHRH